MSVSHTSGRRAASDVTLQVVTRVLNLALGVFVTALLVRTLGDAGYGEWSTLLVGIQLAGYFATFGLQGVVVREAAADPSREAEWLGALLLLRALLSIPALIVGLAIVLLVQKDSAMIISGLILLASFPLSVGASLQVVHQLRVRNAWPMLVLTFNSVTWGILVLVLHVHDGGLIAFSVAMTGVTVLSALLQTVGALRIIRPRRPSREAVMHLGRVALPVGIAGMLTLAYARIDSLIVFEVAGSRDAGLYAAVYRLLDQAHFVPVSIMTTLAPIIAASWPAHPERMLQITRQAVEFLCMFSLGGLVFAIVASEPLTRLLFGPEFVAAAPALPVLGGAFVFICFGYLTGNLLLVTKLQSTLVVVGLAALVLNVVANLLLVPSGGFMAAAWVTLATEALVVLLSAWVVRGPRGLDLGWPPLGRLPRIVAAAAGLGATLVALDAAGAPLAVLIAATVLIYPALLFGLRALRPGEIRELLLPAGAGVSRAAVASLLALLLCLAAGCGGVDPRPLRLGLIADSAGAGPLLDHHQHAAGALGARWLREQLDWAEVEPRPGELHWKRFDAALDAAARRGLLVLPLLTHAPGWARPPDGGLPTDPAPFARFTRAVVARYGPAGAFWRTRPDLRRLAPRWFELWNEPYFVAPDAGDQDARRYARLAAAGTAAAHAADPAARVLVALRTSNATPPAEATGWLDTLARTEPRLLHAADGVTAHPYTNPPADSLRALDGLLALLRNRGVHLPVWVTEIGWSTCRGDWGCVSEGEQARDLTTFADGALEHPEVAAVFVYHLSSWSNPTGGPREGAFGLLRVDGSRKPAWDAYRDLAKRTSG